MFSDHIAKILLIVVSILFIWWIWQIYHKYITYLRRKSSRKTTYYEEINKNKLLIDQIKQQGQRGQINNQYKIALVKYYLALKDLYFDGIPDKYDINGNKIKGVPPNPTMAIHYTKLAIENGYLHGWLDLASMYHLGFYDFPSNLDIAGDIYRFIIENVHDENIVNQAYRLYNELIEESERIKTHQWLNLPYTSTIRPQKTRYEMTQKPTARHHQYQIPFMGNMVDDIGEIDVNTIFRANNNTNMNDNPQTENVINHGQIKNDMHNVHDHAVIATINQSIDKLKKETSIKKETHTCLQEIRNYLSNLPNNDKKNDSIIALDAIEKSFLPLSFSNLTESDVLCLVWNRIHDDIHSDNINKLKENLADELAECIEHDKPVCSTGRFVRILDTLNVVDPAVSIRPTFVVNDEIMTKVGKIRDDHYNLLTEPEKELVDSIAPNEFQKQWTQTLKDDILNQLNEEYVKTGIMTPETFKIETKKWIDEI